MYFFLKSNPADPHPDDHPQIIFYLYPSLLLIFNLMFNVIVIVPRNSLLYNLPKGSIERLQKIQNQAARILTKTPRCDHISEVLVSLHWLKIEQRIIYKILILTFKAFVDHTAPLYLSELVKKKSSSTNTRSANDDLLLVIPPLSRNCSNTFFERSFNFAAPTEWNRLDKRIRRISNLNTFKSEIKTIMFLNYFDV